MRRIGNLVVMTVEDYKSRQDFRDGLFLKNISDEKTINHLKNDLEWKNEQLRDFINLAKKNGLEGEAIEILYRVRDIDTYTSCAEGVTFTF